MKDGRHHCSYDMKSGSNNGTSRINWDCTGASWGCLDGCLHNETTSNGVGFIGGKTTGAKTPHLQRLAIRVLSRGSGASPCERVWSEFTFVASKK